MAIDMQSLLWLFPISFMIHDFEEIVFWESWMAKNGPELTRRAPAFLTNLANDFVRKSTAQISVTVFLIFCLTTVSALLATAAEHWPLFLILMSMFFLHGFGHIGQAILLRRYVPGLITSVLVVIPYGTWATRRVLSAGIVDLSGLLVYLVVAVVLTPPFILLMHMIGSYLYPRVLRSLIR